MNVYVIQIENDNECRCECKELADWGSCKNDYLWNPSTCDCEYFDIKLLIINIIV